MYAMKITTEHEYANGLIAKEKDPAMIPLSSEETRMLVLPTSCRLFAVVSFPTSSERHKHHFAA